MMSAPDGFYLLSDCVKGVDHKPTVGVLLCKTPNKTVVQYSLKGLNTPIGVSDYELIKALPAQLEAEMPTVEELEAELEKEYRRITSTAQEVLEILKQKLINVK